MNWIRFDCKDSLTWPKDDSLKLIRYVDISGHTYYTTTNWSLKNTDEKSIPFWGPYLRDCNGNKIFVTLNSTEFLNKNTHTLLTHWANIDDPNDGYWQEYEHENGGTYADKEWSTVNVNVKIINGLDKIQQTLTVKNPKNLMI